MFIELAYRFVKTYCDDKIVIDYHDKDIEIVNVMQVNHKNYAKVEVKDSNKRKHYFELCYNQETKKITLDYYVKVDTYVFAK